ncbi:hypothetical protein [Nostoc phage NMeng1]|nr:hypothetical protein [Nostoc phage NMeng1]
MIGFSTIWSWISGKAIAIAAGIIAVGVLLREVKTAGRNAEKVQQHDKETKAHDQAQTVVRDIDSRSDADVERMLRDRWSR